MPTEKVKVLVPLVAVFLVDYFGTRAHRDWDVTADAPSRLLMLTPWLLGFVVYQLLNPGYIGWWARMWHHVDRSLHLSVQTWMSASVFSFVAAAIVTGNPITVELLAYSPDSKVAARTVVPLGAGEYLQKGGIFKSLGFNNVYNGRITARVISGTGRVAAYGSVIDNRTTDPTYVPSQ